MTTHHKNLFKEGINFLWIIYQDDGQIIGVKSVATSTAISPTSTTTISSPSSETTSAASEETSSSTIIGMTSSSIVSSSFVSTNIKTSTVSRFMPSTSTARSWFISFIYSTLLSSMITAILSVSKPSNKLLGSFEYLPFLMFFLFFIGNTIGTLVCS